MTNVVKEGRSCDDGVVFSEEFALRCFDLRKVILDTNNINTIIFSTFNRMLFRLKHFHFHDKNSDWIIVYLFTLLLVFLWWNPNFFMTSEETYEIQNKSDGIFRIAFILSKMNQITKIKSEVQGNTLNFDIYFIPGHSYSQFWAIMTWIQGPWLVRLKNCSF